MATMTGPMSKDSHSGGMKFPVKEKDGTTGGSLPSATNSSEAARSAIMKLKFSGAGGAPSTNVEGTMKRPPKKA